LDNEWQEEPVFPHPEISGRDYGFNRCETKENELGQKGEWQHSTLNLGKNSYRKKTTFRENLLKQRWLQSCRSKNRKRSHENGGKTRKKGKINTAFDCKQSEIAQATKIGVTAIHLL